MKLGQNMSTKILKNPSVGEILKKEFLEELGLSQNALAKAISVPSNRIHEIIRGRRSITADTDLRLCKFFQLSEGYFLRLQVSCELMEAKRLIKHKLRCIKTYSEFKQVATVTS